MKTYFCNDCEGSDVYRIRIAYWSDVKQTWTDEPFADEYQCAACGSKDVKEKEINQ